ncbi:Clr6 histone deacetylase associated PHD protein-2 Cph2 [Ascochyta rabiei]|uniref:Clr6 histone deacetylase associated PHD protein-2 Cph2 n=1 Tax=Didymella rabiei TaxID=5454 RepID=UPI0021FEE4FB|nr:Clr6 histone deacetylase associated PHD protein-2 Cph2 [Ascochyta rabiei]UPX17461.1 Clr6 histone deacetylase associated PHD protein-2 Cph2 [Ascochyta rabiei]
MAVLTRREQVGPYCVFDDYASPHHQQQQQPQPTSRQEPPPPPPPPLLRTPTDDSMEDPMMSSDFPFGGMRGPWLSTAGDDMTLAAPANDLTSWNEWMQYNPAAASQNPQPSQPPPMTEAQATAVPISAPMYAPSGVPFTFGGSVDMPAAFDFNGNALSSPSTVDPHQQNGFYSPPMWQQQPPPPPQPQQALYTPTPFVHPGPPASTPSLHHSPGSLHNGTSSSHSSPEPATSSKKRKSTEDTEDLDEPPSSKKGASQPPKKTAHNMIEKRYRTNLNDKIAALRDSVPSLRVMSRPNGTDEDDDPEDLEGLTPAHKLNKATVLSKATEYIRHLEKRNKRLADEVATLKGRIESYEKMAISGPMTLHGSVGTPEASRFQEDPFAHHMPMAGPPQGMIPVPDNIRALQQGLPPQQHYAHAYPQYTAQPRQAPGPPMVNGRRSSAMMGKLMVGSLAGLMILEGFSAREQPQEELSGRGLFALPINLASILSPTTSLGATTAQIPIAKLLLVFGAFFYLFAPLLTPKPKLKKKSLPAFLLAPAPSLASPVEVRRKAWLTAIQTVWVPQHNFALELAALLLKTLKLSTRRIIGWHGYAYLTGTTKDQEVARVKAWNIALDAQLTGGDAEISKSRLVLSLMASGTLPDTPARLMLKALHTRVLLWEASSATHGGWRVVDELSAKLARSYWNAARSEHRIASHLKGTEAEPLPDHLAALIERECDEVLVPSIVQRAYNLAWNRPSAENTVVDPSMDGVVEDFAISSPLDALAAWHSSLVLNRGLAAYLAAKTVDSTLDLDLALQTAPANSQAQVRALVADAVVFDEDRDARIAKALEALPTPPSSKASETGLNLVGDATVAVDVRKALTMAKCLSLIESPHRHAHKRAIYVVNNTFLPECTTTLLGFVAGYKILVRFMEDASLQVQTSSGLERITSALRLWVGREAGRRSGLSNKARTRIVAYCVKSSKTLVGLAEVDVDDGYASASVKDDETCQ